MPADWASFFTGAEIEVFLQIWANTLWEYVKTDPVFKDPDGNVYERWVDPNPRRPPWILSRNFNGMLHSYPKAEVAEPSKLPLFWMGHYRNYTLGATLSNPALACSRFDPCRFRPNDYPGQGPGLFGGTKYGYAWWDLGPTADMSVYDVGTGHTIVTVDLGARFVDMYAPNWPGFDRNANTRPFSSMAPGDPGTRGEPYWMTECVAPGTTRGVCYPCFFRPDSTFDW